MPRPTPDPKDVQALSDNLVRFLDAHKGKLTQDDLARIVGIPPSSMNRYVRGRGGLPSYPSLKALAFACGWTAEELLKPGVALKPPPKLQPAEAPPPHLAHAFQRKPDGTWPTKQEVIAALQESDKKPSAKKRVRD